MSSKRHGNINTMQMKGAVMAKVNNVVRLVQFENESDFYYGLESDLTSILGEPDARCYKVKHIQLLNESCALVYFEEDINTVMVRFFHNGEQIFLEDAPDLINYYSIQELSFIDNIGTVCIGDVEYDIEEIKYVIDIYGARHADIYLN